MAYRIGYQDRVKGARASRNARDYASMRMDMLTAPEHKPTAWDAAKRLRSSGYVPEEHIRKHGDWHVYATDRGIVAITRHPGGRWEIRPFTPPTKETT